MSTIKLENIQTRTGSGTITIGASGETVEVASGVTTNLKNGATLSDNILFDTASKGIYLGVTTPTASNLLNDYEEGTWTPVYKGTTTDPVVTYSSGRFGRYTKIGRIVYIQALILTASLTSVGSGSLRIDGLPFTVNSDYRASIYIGTHNDWGTDNHPNNGFMIQNTTEIQLYKFPSDPRDEWEQLDAAGMITGGNNNMIGFSGWYEV